MKPVSVSRRLFLQSSTVAVTWLAALARHHRACAGCDDENEMFIVASHDPNMPTAGSITTIWSKV